MSSNAQRHTGKLKIIASWIMAGLVGFIAATLCHSLLVQSKLVAMGVNLDAPTRVKAWCDDLVGLSPTYLPIILIGFAIAFTVAALIGTKITKLTPRSRGLLYTFAGGAALASILGLMQPIMEITLIAGARGVLGFSLQVLAGALGGWVFAQLSAQRQHPIQAPH